MDVPTGEDDNSATAPAAIWDDVAYIARVTKARLARKMTIAELSRRTGRSPAYFRARPGKSRQIDDIFAVAAALEVSPGYLIGLEEYRDSQIRRVRAFADIAAHLFCAVTREREVTPDEIIEVLRPLMKEPQDEG
jgi:transcriptional regulator with XRE-family HTH domain